LPNLYTHTHTPYLVSADTEHCHKGTRG